MLLGSFAVILTGEITLLKAISAINLDVLLLLFCMFIIGQAMEDSGYLSHLSYELFKRADTPNKLLIIVILVTGVGSALLMNDTLALIGTPVMLLLAKKHRIRAKMFCLHLRFQLQLTV